VSSDVATGTDVGSAPPGKGIPTSVKVLELAAIVPLLAWIGVTAIRDPGVFADAGLI